MEQFETISTEGQFFLVVNTATGLVSDVDEGIVEVTGWSVNELIGEPWIDFTNRADREGIKAAMLGLAQEGRCRWAARLRHADGRFVLYQIISTIGADGESAYLWARDARRIVDEKADLWQYEKLMEMANDVFVVTDAAANILTVNRAGERVHGLDRAEMVGMNLLDFVAEEGAEVLASIAKRAAAGEEVIEFHMPAIDHDGRPIYMEGFTTFDRETQRYYTVERDMTERVTRERELEIGHRFFDLSRSHLAMIDNSGHILRANPAMLAFLRSGADVTGRPLLAMLGLPEAGPMAAALREAADSRDTRTLNALVAIGDAERTVTCTFTPSDDGEALFYSGRDVTEEQRLADELLDRATHDQLTRLATREVFNDALDTALVSGAQVGVVMADLDDFKRVNDGLGHGAGDELLRQVGRRIAATVREDDLVARFGGDEFVVLLRGLRSEQSALDAAEKIRWAVAKPYWITGREVHVGISLGVTVGSAPDHSPSRLLREADAAAYAAKRAGRNTVRLSDYGIEASIVRDQSVEVELRAALNQGTLDVDVQGVFTTDGELSGLEALVRMPGADGVRHGPGRFLDIAGRLGLLVELGDAVIDRTFERLSPWLSENPMCFASVNADPAELAAPGYASRFAAALERHDVAATQVIVEATEKSMVEPEGRAARTLDELRGLGVTIAIDDFGTGASSLGYLRDLKVDVVKIDKSVIQTLAEDVVARSITVAVLCLATDLDMPIIAEGVEHAELLPILHDLGCPLVQGFALHRPEPVDEFLTSALARSLALPTSALDYN